MSYFFILDNSLYFLRESFVLLCLSGYFFFASKTLRLKETQKKYPTLYYSHRLYIFFCKLQKCVTTKDTKGSQKQIKKNLKLCIVSIFKEIESTFFFDRYFHLYDY